MAVVSSSGQKRAVWSNNLLCALAWRSWVERTLIIRQLVVCVMRARATSSVLRWAGDGSSSSRSSVVSASRCELYCAPSSLSTVLPTPQNKRESKHEHNHSHHSHQQQQQQRAHLARTSATVDWLTDWVSLLLLMGASKTDAGVATATAPNKLNSIELNW